MAAAVGMIAGCQKSEMVQIATPENVVAPVLEAVEGPVEITPTNLATDTLAFTWSLADYGVLTQVNYSIEAATAAKPDAKVTLTSGVTADTTALRLNSLTAKVSYEELNAILFNDLKLNDGVAEDVLFTIGAKVGEYQKIYSNSITVSCKVTAAEKQYPKLTVAGSYAYNNWSPGKGQFVFDFDGTDTKYSGVIDFGEDVSALNFKFVGEAWGTNEYSVPEGTEQTAEAAELPLQAGGGDNISAYTTHRYYSLTLDKATPKVIKNFSFNQIGVIGSFNGWAADEVMTFNTEKQRFYADVEFTEDGQFKLRADADWTLNWGADAFGVSVSNGDGNLEAKAGKYRIYANMNNPAEMTIELNAGMYGKDEPVGGTTTEPEPEPTPTLTGWGVVGTITGWADGADLMMTNDGTWYVVKGVEFGAEDKFKIRLDGKWDTSFGGEFKANEEVTLTSENGPDIVPAAGTYDIYFNPENGKAWFINDGSYPGGGAAPEASPWSLIGDFNSWGGDYAMVVDGEYHVAYGFTLASDSGLKFRKDGQWNYKDDAGNEIQTNLGGSPFSADAEIALSAGGANIPVTAGTYDVYLKVAEDGSTGVAYFMTGGKTPADAGEVEIQKVDYSDCQMELVGNGVVEQTGTAPDTAWTWGNTLLASNEGKPAKSGDVYTWTWNNVSLSADGWKIRTLGAAASGGVNSFDLGADIIDTANSVAGTSTSGNITLAAAGNYNITLVIDADADTKTITIVSAN